MSLIELSEPTWKKVEEKNSKDNKVSILTQVLLEKITEHLTPNHQLQVLKALKLLLNFKDNITVQVIYLLSKKMKVLLLTQFIKEREQIIKTNLELKPCWIWNILLLIN